MCCETKSEKKKKGSISSLMGGDTDWVHHTGMLVTPTTLIWARSRAKSGTVVATTRLKDIQVRDFESDLIEGHGM